MSMLKRNVKIIKLKILIFLFQVLQTDIESHGRIVKLVLGLCEELSQDPGLYDLQVGRGPGRGVERNRGERIGSRSWIRSRSRIKGIYMNMDCHTSVQAHCAWLPLTSPSAFLPVSYSTFQ